jgi:hypothetical protein
MSTPFNEIITFGKGYQMNKGIEVFVQSAKNHYRNISILDISNASDTIDYLYGEDVAAVDGRTITEKYNVDLTLSPYTLKVIMFYLYLKHHSVADNVYMTDFTDVLFQGDIFEDMVEDKVTLFSEENIIGKCQTNSTWVKVCYNQDILGLLKDKPILNGGCILGKRELVINLLKEMCIESTNIISRIGNYQNIDQAILNKVVHFDYNRYHIDNSKVANLAQKMNRDKHVKIEKGVFGFERNFKSRDVEIPKIIHQYDVNKQLEKEIYATYCK